MVYNNYQSWIMESEAITSTHRRLYETVVSNVATVQAKEEAVISILRLALTDHSHFSFLLTQVNWFSPANSELLPLLGKILRLYRGMCRQAPRVANNLLAQGLAISNINIAVVDILTQTLRNTPDHPIMLECLRENYPHKVCPADQHVAYIESLLKLTQNLPQQRFDILEIIIQNLAYFDTEMRLGEQFTREFQPEDYKILALRSECGELEQKFDKILSILLKYLQGINPSIQQVVLKEVFIIFQKVIMIVDNTKMMQLVIFLMAELSTKHSTTFLTLLLATIMENYNKNGSRRLFICALQYLSSYICRSITLEDKKVKKVVSMLISQLKTNIQNKQSHPFDSLNIYEFADQNSPHLHFFNTLLLIFSYRPSLKQSLCTEFEEIINLGHQKLHISLFIDQEVLKFHRIELNSKLSKRHWTVPIINKFIPVFLEKCEDLVKMRVHQGVKRVRRSQMEHQGQGVPKKRVKHRGDLTPITIGEYQL